VFPGVAPRVPVTGCRPNRWVPLGSNVSRSRNRPPGPFGRSGAHGGLRLTRSDRPGYHDDALHLIGPPLAANEAEMIELGRSNRLVLRCGRILMLLTVVPVAAAGPMSRFGVVFHDHGGHAGHAHLVSDSEFDRPTDTHACQHASDGHCDRVPSPSPERTQSRARGESPLVPLRCEGCRTFVISSCEAIAVRPATQTLAELSPRSDRPATCAELADVDDAGPLRRLRQDQQGQCALRSPCRVAALLLSSHALLL